MCDSGSEAEARGDAVLVAAAVDGDSEAFGRLARRHRGRIFRLCVSVLGPGGRAEAEDLAQDALLLAFQKLPGLRDRERFAPWLNRIAWRLALDRKRTPRHRRPHLPDEALAGVADPGADPLAAERARRRARRVEAAVGRLPPLYRSVLFQRYWLGASVGEIADALGVPQGTVKSYLFRGRQRLKRNLVRRGFGDE